MPPSERWHPTIAPNVPGIFRLAAWEAAAVVARQRGWPAGADAEIKDAMRRIDAENGKGLDVVAEFHTAELFRDNANHNFLEKDEVIWLQPVVHSFVSRMLAFCPPEESVGC